MLRALTHILLIAVVFGQMFGSVLVARSNCQQTVCECSQDFDSEISCCCAHPDVSGACCRGSSESDDCGKSLIPTSHICDCGCSDSEKPKPVPTSSRAFELLLSIEQATTKLPLPIRCTAKCSVDETSVAICDQDVHSRLCRWLI